MVRNIFNIELYVTFNPSKEIYNRLNPRQNLDYSNTCITNGIINGGATWGPKGALAPPKFLKKFINFFFENILNNLKILK